MNKLATIIPVYMKDDLSFFKLSIESIIIQTYSDYHIFIGVDGPVDKNMQHYLQELEKDDKISIVWFKENRGMTAVLNDLLSIVINQGYDFIARMDADDISVNDRFEKQLSFLEKNENVDVVGGQVEIIDSEGRTKGVKKYPLTHDECCSRFARRNPFSHPAVIFRKRFFDKIGSYYRSEYRTNQDTLLWYDGLMHGVIMANLPDVVLKFRVTDSMLSKRRGGWSRAKKQLETRLMINKGLGYGLKSNIYALLIFVYMVSPLSIKKIAIKYFNV